ncbi:hypothetical protein OHS58_10295 [Amycolatopsis sp. NBC_00348]|uniref:hypothetical protein n=1 Tax=Amycolatopsis sp. NBC_00348 TaxID=2975956 RepID=UPI002E25AC77
MFEALHLVVAVWQPLPTTVPRWANRVAGSAHRNMVSATSDHQPWRTVDSCALAMGGVVGRIVCMHGIGQQVASEQSLLREWTPALLDGLTRAGHGDSATADDMSMGFYGDLFRPAGEMLAVGDPMFTAADVDPGLEEELLLAWWRGAARVDPKVAPPEADTLVRASSSVQAALRQLSRSRFFGGLALRALVFDLKQVRRYLQDQQLRDAARAAVRKLITADTQVVVAHSLGSVVAYEALAAMPDHQVQALATLGSPLGIANLIFGQLDPRPRDGLGAWPGSDTLVWTNVADYGDVVALEKDLRPGFGPRVINAVVHNGAHAHTVTAYLTDKLTGAAIAGGLGAR